MDYNLITTEADIFDALAHPARLEILEVLRGREACVCHIQAVSNQRQAYISQQLNVLRQAGLVTSRKDGQWTFYRTSDQRLYTLIDEVKEFVLASGKLQVDGQDERDLDQRQKKCNCPQCSTEAVIQACVPMDGTRV